MSERKLQVEVVAAVRESPGGVHALVARPGEIIAASTFPVGSGFEVESWARQQGAERIIRLAPMRQTLVRSVELPSTADAIAIGPALSLLAEAELPASIPFHRRTGGLVVTPGGGRAGLLTAWTGTDVPSPLGELPERWSTPAGALAMLWRGRGTAAVASPAEGSVCVLVAGPGRPGARIVPEESADAHAWTESVREIVSETAAAAGVAPAPVATSGLTIDSASADELAAAWKNARNDREWWNTFGLCLGAAAAALDSQPATRSLANLWSEAPKPQESGLAKAGRWLSEPKRAWGAVAAAVVLLIATPPLFAWSRAKILESRRDRINKLAGGRDELESKAALYAQLEQSRWPVTKLLSDISRSAPVGVSIDNLRLGIGQGLSLHGSAKNAEQVNDFQARLGATRVFSEVTKSRVESKGGDRFEFDLTAKIASPHTPIPADSEDFAAAGKTLAERLYGPGAKLPTAPPPEPRSSRRGDRSDSGTSRPDGDTNRRSSSTVPDTVPPAVTDADIAKMSFGDATKGWTSRKSYVQKHPELDAATKQRLGEEEQKMRDRAAAAREGK